MTTEITLRKDKEWKLVESKLCLVKDFLPIGSKVINGEVISPDTNLPYCQIRFKCVGIEHEIKGLITHKIDFKNLWEIYIERGIKKEEEVLIYWTTNHYNSKICKLLHLMYPKIVIMVCPIGTYNSCPEGFELEHNRDLMVNVYGLSPTFFCVPDIMK